LKIAVLILLSNLLKEDQADRADLNDI